jgi:endo-1,4-beta-xylanase
VAPVQQREWKTVLHQFVNDPSQGGLIPLGYAITSADLDVPERQAAILRDCRAVTPEYEGKWDAVCGRDGAPDFGSMDRLAAFARANAMDLHGHTLCWHRAIPRHFRDAEPNQFRSAATSYIAETVHRYRGAMHSWHVVNEPLRLADGRSDGLRQTPFLAAIGPEYLHELFFLAASLDPNAVLVLNEMGLEYDSPHAEQKRDAMLRLLETAVARDVPITCLGIQSHLHARDFNNGDHRCFSNWLRRVSELGISIMLTELDVDDRGLGGDLTMRDAAVADVCRNYVSLVLENADLRCVTLWGLSDDRSWLNADRGSSEARPLALDRDLTRKPVWQTLAALLGQR